MIFRLLQQSDGQQISIKKLVKIVFYQLKMN